jgi:hypothetical protein
MFAAMVLEHKRIKKSKMQSFNRQHTFNTMPKQAGVIASGWSTINCGSLSYDRLPEIIRVREGWDG